MNDTISRQMAIEAVQNRHMMLSKEKVLLINDLEKLPSAQLATDTNVGAKLGTDCISRQEAIDIVDGWFKRIGLNGDICVDGLRQLPSAQPERIKGHWIKISPANIYECSECGKHVMTNDICAYDFCHGCGTDIRGDG